MTDQSHLASGPASACPDLETLAEFQAGALDEPRVAEVAAHVSADPRCQQVLAALDATIAQLRSVPPVQMPEHLARRLSAALAAEAGHGAPIESEQRSAPTLGSVPQAVPAQPRTAPSTLPPRDSSASDASNVSDLGAAREKRASRSKMWLAAAAAAVVVGGGVVFATQNSGEDDPAFQADETSQSAQVDDATAGDGAAPGGAALGFGSPSDVLDKGEIVDDEVSEEIAGEMAETQKRNKCVNEIVPRPLKAPEAVQQGEYDGQAAYAFIFPTNEDDIVEMIVVDAADCSTVLHTETGPR